MPEQNQTKKSLTSGVNKTWQRRIANTKGRGPEIARTTGSALGALSFVILIIIGACSTPDDVAAQARSAVNKAAAVGSFAQDCVSTWLTATSKDSAAIQDCTTVASGELKLPTTPLVLAGNPSVVAVTYSGKAGRDSDTDLYSVIIGVNQRPYGSATPLRALYRVSVSLNQYGTRLTTLPARIGGLGSGADLPTDYPADLGPQDQLFTLASGFLEAYLTPAGGVDRYVTADSGLVTLGAVYQSVWVTSAAASTVPPAYAPDGSVVRLLVHASASASKVSDEQKKRRQYPPSIQMVYPLSVLKVSGQWQIAAVDESPAMSNEDALSPVAGHQPK